MNNTFQNQIKPIIPNPCHEDWSKMTPEDKGRHCGVCDKVVIDFTKMNPTLVQQTIQENSKGGVCGHFLKEQLTTPIEVKVNTPYSRMYNKWFAFWGFLGLISLTNQSCAQETKTTAGKPVISESHDQKTRGTVAIVQGDTLQAEPIEVTVGELVEPICDPQTVDGEIAPVEELKGDVDIHQTGIQPIKVDKDAFYEGGDAALKRYLSDKIVLSRKELEKERDSVMHFKLIIDSTGKIVHAEPKGVVNANIMGKIIRVLYDMPAWVPAQKGGKNVRSYKELPIIFR